MGLPSQTGFPDFGDAMPVSSNESGGLENTFETEEDEKENDEELDVALVNLKQRRGRCRPVCTFQMSVQYIRPIPSQYCSFYILQDMLRYGDATFFGWP